MADTAQFYEEVDSMKVIEALDWLIAKTREKGYKRSCFPAQEPQKGFLHKESGFTRKNYEVWPLQNVKIGICTALASSKVSLGRDTLWCQARGLPIGGMVSKVCCSLVMGKAETDWDDNFARRAQLGFDDVPCGNARYVDDLLTFNAGWCRTCAIQRLRHVYPEGIMFNEQPNKNGWATWLDMELRVEPSKLLVQIKKGEKDFVSGQSEKPSKHVVPPFLGKRMMDSRILKGLVRGRLARLRQMQLSKEVLFDALKYEYLLWKKTGYDGPSLERLWCHVKDYEVEGQFIKNLINASALRAQNHDILSAPGTMQTHSLAVSLH